ncbi:MAG: serine/threonine protein kinase [Elusimicrobia bacterium]|nr:serine/threonine protein kinase [Elusimicrobiota bacterium]
MRPLFALLLLGGLAAGARATAPAEKANRERERVQVEALDVVYERHKDVLRELNRLIAAMRREREGFQAAPERARLERWALLVSSSHALVPLEERLWREHHAGMKLVELTAVARVIGRLDRGEPPIQNTSGPMLQTQNHDELMRSAHNRYHDALKRETVVFQAAWEQRLAEDLRAAAVASWRRRLFAAAAAALAAALSWLALRRASPAPGQAAPAARLIAENLEVKGIIGRGAMGEVYEAFDRTLGRRVALKRLRAELLASPADLELLLAEARTVASLRHPGLVAIHSVERDTGQVYLAFEFVEGRTLAAFLAERGRLEWSEALRVFKACCAALAYAHSRRVVHRDLKPANIMVASDGAVKVMDFGIAYTAQKSISRLTRAAAWGTPPYMAPEQELGGVSAAVDLYSLSVCFYEMLTGELPFKGPNFLAQKREELYAPPAGLIDGLPAGIDAFFKTALAPEPSRRFATAEALAAAAEACS